MKTRRKRIRKMRMMNKTMKKKRMLIVDFVAVAVLAVVWVP